MKTANHYFQQPRKHFQIACLTQLAAWKKKHKKQQNLQWLVWYFLKHACSGLDGNLASVIAACSFSRNAHPGMSPRYLAFWDKAMCGNISKATCLMLGMLEFRETKWQTHITTTMVFKVGVTRGQLGSSANWSEAGAEVLPTNFYLFSLFLKICSLPRWCQPMATRCKPLSPF